MRLVRGIGRVVRGGRPLRGCHRSCRPPDQRPELVAKLVENSVLGGVASVAGGGKFANGAVTGAFGYLTSPEFQNDDVAYGDAYDSATSSLFNDGLDVLGHYARMLAIVAWLKLQGYTVETEVRLWGYGELGRADIMYQDKDNQVCACVQQQTGRWGIIDIKTAQWPDLSLGQEAAYRAFNVGSAYSDASRISSFGYQPYQTLPAGTVWIIGPGKQGTIWPPVSFPR